MARLRAVAATAAEHGGADGLAFAQAVATYDAGKGEIALERALGLTPDRGAVPWWHAEARQHRDRLLRRAQAVFCSGQSAAGAADTIAAAIARYEAGAWLRERALHDPPPARSGKMEELAFLVLKLGAAPSARRIRAVLATEVGHSTPPSNGQLIGASEAA
jgi:hypothetical protein